MIRAILFSLLVSFKMYACPDRISPNINDSCNSGYNMDLLKAQYSELLADDFFKDLEGIDIEILPFESDAYFLATGIKKVFRKKCNRKYLLKINKNLFKCAPSNRAMKAILAQELVHIKDYSSRGFFGVAGFGSNYVFSPKNIERWTDMQVLKQGYVNGISEYRQWIYPRLSKRNLKKKKKRYYTPQEISELVDRGELTALD